jgi:glutamate-1-semialdehyde aminotransferase
VTLPPAQAARELDVRHLSHDLPAKVAPGQVFGVRLELENSGTEIWHASSPHGDHVGLAVHWDGVVIANHVLPRAEVRPGERAVLHFAVEAPLAPGKHRLALKMVRYQVAVFADRGAAALEQEIEVEDAAPERNARLWAGLQRVDPWHYIPTRGLARLRDGTPLPVFVERAQGCHLWDASGRCYVDYTMGWGSVLLGYAHPEVSAALAESARNAPTVAWPQPVEIEVAERLCEDFPGAEMVCFGKNGSDACTFAARMARIFTGRKTILFSGYHGWQDFWVEQVGFERTGVVPREPALIQRFPFHDLDSFRTLYERHRGDLAAVFVEPSPWAGNGLGFEPDSDPLFLRTLARLAREAGALFVMDEIVTGYRYPEKSAQAAKGVVADLTCLGKAIASGAPLSAVVGRAEIFKSALPRTFYAATFHAEAHSLAAARASIDVYRREPVAAHVWDYGTRLRQGLEALVRELGLGAELWGPPFRMNLRFTRADPAELLKERTLLQQELLRGGVTTINGIMLPCYAHDQQTLRFTLEVWGRALEIVARAGRCGSFDDLLEIPPLVDG